jgi:hypothetical protein
MRARLLYTAAELPPPHSPLAPRIRQAGAGIADPQERDRILGALAGHERAEPAVCRATVLEDAAGSERGAASIEAWIESATESQREAEGGAKAASRTAAQLRDRARAFRTVAAV